MYSGICPGGGLNFLLFPGVAKHPLGPIPPEIKSFLCSRGGFALFISTP